MNFESSFDRLRAVCGEDEVAPIHPFKLELQITETRTVEGGLSTSETRTLHEGLYVFAPDALTPECGSVRLMLYLDDDPDEADTLEVDPAVLDRIRQDFAAFGAGAGRS